MLNDAYWVGLRRPNKYSKYTWYDGTPYTEDLPIGDRGNCAVIMHDQVTLRKGRCKADENKYICQRANCETSAGWYSLFNVCVWVSTKQTSTYTSCKDIGGRLLQWHLLDAGKKYLLSPPLVVDHPYAYTVNDDACCCSWWWYCASDFMRNVYREANYGWQDGYCNYEQPQFICQSASVHRSTTTAQQFRTTPEIPSTTFMPRTTTVSHTTIALNTTSSKSTTPMTTSTPTSTSAQPREVTSTTSQFSTPMMRSTEHVSLNTDATTSPVDRNVSQGGSSAPHVSGDNSIVAYGAGGGVAALVLLVAVAAVVAVMLYRRRRARKDTPIEPSSAAAAFHNAAYVDHANVIHSDPRHGADPGQGVYSLATRPLPAQPIGVCGGGGYGNMYDNINDPLFNGNSLASNGHVVSSSSAGNGLVDNAVYSPGNKDKSKGHGSPGLSGSDAQGGGKEDNMVYSTVDKDKAKKGHNRNSAKSADKSFYRPDSTEMVMADNTEYVSGDDSGISTSETDYSEIKGSGRNMGDLSHIDHPESSNTRPDSTELLMSENTLYGDGSRNDGNDPADTDYYNVRGTENNLDRQTNQPATKSADRPDENEYYNVRDFQSHNANSDIGPRSRESLGLTLEENDVYCLGN